MKKIIRYLAAMMVAIMVATGVQPAYMAQAAQYDENYIFTDKFEAVEYLNEGIKAHNGTVQFILSPSLYTDCSAYDAFLEILNLTPYYYEAGGASITYGAVTGGTRFKVTPNYKYDATEHQKLDAEISKIIDGLNLDGKSEYQKVRAIYDYICDNVNYDFTYTKRSAYEAIFDGEVVCQGYATLFYIMCEEAGLNSDVVVGLGNGGGHAWNIVEIGGEYYNVDSTWDGSYDTTYHTYFLNNDDDFSNHVRDAEFLSAEYYEKYPMADYSWVDYSNLDYETVDIANLSQKTFNTITGGTVTNRAGNGRGKILIFGSSTCGYTKSNITNISSIDLSNVDIVFLEAKNSSLSTVSSIKDTYDNGKNNIQYAYATDGTINSAMWEYVKATLGVNSITYPVIMFIDANNRIKYYTSGTIISAGMYENYISTYIKGEEIVELTKTSLDLNAGKKENLTVKVYGKPVNSQFVTWTSSNPSVATVDYNGVVKGLKAGTSVITCKINDKVSSTCTVTVTGQMLPDGLNKGPDGLWYYYVDNEVDTSFTGMAQNQYGWWYVKNGQLDRTYTGMAQNQYGWWYMKNGQLDRTYTGMAQNQYGWFYMKNGKLDRTYTGISYNQYGRFYIKNGQLDRTYTGMVLDTDGWCYVKEGKVDPNYTGMAQNQYGWWYMKNGKLDRTYTGMAQNQYGWFYMKNGQLDRTFTGMARNDYGWWYIKNGQLDRTYTGLATNPYGTWYMQNGKLDTKFSGKVTLNGKTYTIVNGKVM